MAAVVLVGVPNETAEALRAASGHQLTEAAAEVMNARLRDPRVAHAIDVLVVGPAAADPIRLAQLAQVADHDLSVLLVGDPALSDALQRLPYVSSAVRCVADVPACLAVAIDEAAEQSSQRRRYQVVAASATAQLRADGRTRRNDVTFLQHVLEHVPVAILALDPGGRIQASNRTAHQLFGRAERDLHGREIGEGLSALERELLAGTIATAVECPGWAPEVSLTLVDPAGAVRIVEASARVFPSQGDPSVVVVMQDVTEQRRMTAQLQTADRLASVGLLAAGVAHEINNPLTAVMMNLAHTLRRPDLAPPVQRCLQDALDAADRIRRIVRDLTLLARGEDELRTPVDTEEVLRSTLRVAANQIHCRTRLVEHYGEVPLSRGSAARLGQVFLNLLVNAVQAMTEDDVERNELRVVTRCTDTEVVTEISDNGPGISAEVMRRLFTPFFTTKQQGEGTGLGLSICHRLVTAMGGRLEIESELGKGTLARVTLPRARAHTPTQPRPGADGHATRDGDRRRVLIVDDDPLVGRAVAAMLAERFDVEVCTSARAALIRAPTGRFAALLCDLMMPDMTGMELHRALHAISPDLAARIIFLTGGAFTPASRAFVATTANAWLEKPFDIERVIALIDGLDPIE
jgi:PAS domain S-box-containing protein